MSNTMPWSFGAPLSATPFFKGANLRGAEEAIVDKSRRICLALRDKLGDDGLKFKGRGCGFVSFIGRVHLMADGCGLAGCSDELGICDLGTLGASVIDSFGKLCVVMMDRWTW